MSTSLRARLLASAGIAALATVVAAGSNGCSVGSGVGSVKGDLCVPDCWSGPFNLQPDFFAATPNQDTLTIRIQRGSDFENFSDGISILVMGVSEIRQTMLGQPLTISLPPSVVPPGVPITPNPNPAKVELAAYLQATCRPATPALYGMDVVSLTGVGDAGTCNLSADGGTTAMQCGPNVQPGPTGTSTITFAHIFDASLANGGDPGSLSAEQRLTDATFDVQLADPRDECPGGIGPPPSSHGHLTGSFRFYFERGKPAQAFP
jgi:hypothetical protein